MVIFCKFDKGEKQNLMNKSFLMIVTCANFPSNLSGINPYDLIVPMLYILSWMGIKQANEQTDYTVDFVHTITAGTGWSYLGTPKKKAPPKKLYDLMIC